MAKKALTYKDIIADIRAKRFSPIYILMGKETWYIDKIVELLESLVVPAEDRDFNQHIFYGADADLDNVVSAARQYPMMGERQLVVLKEAQSMEKAKTRLEKLEQYMRQPVSSTVFVLAYKDDKGDRMKDDKLLLTSPMMQSAAKSGAVIFESPELKEGAVGLAVKDYVAERGYAIEPKAATMIVENTGTSLSKALGAVDKLIVSIGSAGKRIMPDMVERYIGISKDYNGYELSNALESRDFKKAMTIIDHYSKNPKRNSPLGVTATLFNYFTKIAIANYSKDQSDAAIGAATATRNPYALEHLRMAMRSYPGNRPVKAIHAIREMDVKSKGVGSNQDAYQLLKELIFRIFTL